MTDNELRAADMARLIFPDEFHALPTEDCMGEVGREGLPRRICADHTERFAACTRLVLKALIATEGKS